MPSRLLRRLQLLPGLVAATYRCERAQGKPRGVTMRLVARTAVRFLRVPGWVR